MRGIFNPVEKCHWLFRSCAIFTKKRCLTGTLIRFSSYRKELPSLSNLKIVEYSRKCSIISLLLFLYLSSVTINIRHRLKHLGIYLRNIILVKPRPQNEINKNSSNCNIGFGD